VSDEIQHSNGVSVTPEMIEAGVSALAVEAPETEEAMTQSESAALVAAIYAAMSSKIERRP